MTGRIKKYAMWSDLPSEIWTNVFDAMETRKDGLMASAACKTLNEAWYRSRHWSSENTKSFYFKVTPERIPGMIRMFEKAKWNARDVYFFLKKGVFQKIFAKKILKNLKNSNHIYMNFDISKCVDLTSVVKMLPSSLKSVSIDAEAGWTISDKVEFPNTIERIRMTNRIFKNTGHEKPQDGVNLKHLEILNSHPFYILKPCCLKSLDKLETLSLVDTNRFGSIDLHLSKFPVLRRIHMHNGSCSLFKDGSELHIIGFAKKHHVRCMARRPWDELLRYFDREPRGDDADVHYMDDDVYAMDIDGQSVFVNDSWTPINVYVKSSSSSIVIEDGAREYYGSDYESSCESD